MKSLKCGGWCAAICLSVAHLISILDRYLIGVLTEPIKADLGLTDSQIGLLGGLAFALTFSAISLPAGRWADIASRRMMVFTGILIWSLCMILGAFSTSFELLAFTRLGVGFGEALLLPAALSLLASQFAREKLATATSVFTTGGSLGRASAFIGGGMLLAWLTIRGGLVLPLYGEMHPWRGTFFIFGFLGIVVALASLSLTEPPRPQATGDRPTLRQSLAHLRANAGLYLRLFGAHGMITASVAAFGTWIVAALIRDYGLPVQSAGGIAGSVSLVCGPLGGLTGGFLADRFYRRGVEDVVPLLIASAHVLGFAAGIVFFTVHHQTAVIAAYSVAYFAFSMCTPATYSGILLSTPARHHGIITAVAVLIYSLLGNGVGPLVVGKFSDMHVGGSNLSRSLGLGVMLFAMLGLPLALSVRAVYRTAVRKLAAEHG